MIRRGQLLFSDVALNLSECVKNTIIWLSKNVTKVAGVKMISHAAVLKDLRELRKKFCVCNQSHL